MNFTKLLSMPSIHTFITYVHTDPLPTAMLEISVGPYNWFGRVNTLRMQTMQFYLSSMEAVPSRWWQWINAWPHWLLLHSENNLSTTKL